MKWYWKVRLYHPGGHYAIGQISTGEGTREIDAYTDFYHQLTGCKAILEGMSQQAYVCLSIQDAFATIWKREGAK